MHISPARCLIQALGGVRSTSRYLKTDKSTISRWPKCKSIGGADGYVPSRKQRAALLLARDMGFDLTAEDLILGRTVK